MGACVTHMFHCLRRCHPGSTSLGAKMPLKPAFHFNSFKSYCWLCSTNFGTFCGTSLYPPLIKLKGCTQVSLFPSVCPSLCRPNCVCSVSSTMLARSILYVLILSTRCVTCWVFTWGQFWPSGVVIAGTCLCVHVCVNPELVCTKTHHLFKLEPRNMDQRCKTHWLRMIDVDLHGEFNFKLQISWMPDLSTRENT